MLRKKKEASKSEAEETKVETIPAEKALEVTAAMTGTLTFKDPVNLRIDGKFEGTLDTKGQLSIGEHAQIDANITGESVTIAGRVTGNIIASKDLTLLPPALIVGNVETPTLGITPGAILDGKLKMSSVKKEAGPAEEGATTQTLSLQEVASYLEVETRVVEDWASNGKIPARRKGEGWIFDKTKIDQWIADEKINV